MKRWDQRPFEIRNLFNPAFCGLVLFRALHGYEEEDDRGMPFSLSLLVLPLCLHKDSREIIAGSPRSYLLKTAEKNQQIMVGFADMFIPAVLASTIESDITRFVIAAMSVTQLIYMSEVGALLLGSKIPVKLWELFVIFLLRTLVTLPVIAGVAHLLF